MTKPAKPIFTVTLYPPTELPETYLTPDVDSSRTPVISFVVSDGRTITSTLPYKIIKK